MASSLNITTDSRVRRAKEAVDSLDSVRDSSERFREAWQELRRSYEDSATSHSADCQPFPLWAPNQFNPERLERILKWGYYKDLGHVETWASYALQAFDVVAWKFVLFFDRIEQARARAIGKIARKRPGLGIARLYEEVESNRLNRINRQKNPRYEFQPSDFKACLNGSDNEDGSDAEINEASDEEEENEITVADDDESESEDTAWSPEGNSALDDQGIDYVVDLDIRSRSDHGVKERDPPDDRSGYSSLPRSLITNRDETDVPNEMDTPNESDAAEVIANECENEATERNMNPEQRSPLDSHPSGVKSTNAEEQFVQRAPAIVSEFRQLMVERETAAQNTKIIDEKIEENMKEMNQAVRQVLQCNKSASSEDLMAAVTPVFSDIAEQQRKRKMEEKKIENISVKKAKLFDELTAKTQEADPRFQADI